MATTAYSFGNVQATLDGQTIFGFFDMGEVISVVRNADEGSMLSGVDKSTLFSVSTDESAQITIRLKHTSPTHRMLIEKRKRQKALGGKSRGFPLDIIDTSSGEGGSAEQCFIQKSPAASNGNEATVREWVLVTGSWADLVPYGAE